MKGHKNKASFLRKYVKKYIYMANNFVYYMVWVLYWVA